MKNKEELATFGAGCFWCVEAVYQQLPGVRSVVSGYAGGHVEHPMHPRRIVSLSFDPNSKN